MLMKNKMTKNQTTGHMMLGFPWALEGTQPLMWWGPWLTRALLGHTRCKFPEMLPTCSLCRPHSNSVKAFFPHFLRVSSARLPSERDTREPACYGCVLFNHPALLISLLSTKTGPGVSTLAPYAHPPQITERTPGQRCQPR